MNLTMRNRLIFGVLLFTMVESGCTPQIQKEKSPPNIVYIMTDDHAYQAISAYSDKLMQTPNIDRIAKEGAIFTRATVTNSICAPSRAVFTYRKA